MMKMELIFETKIIFQNMRLIGAIYYDNMGNFANLVNKMADIMPLTVLLPALKTT